MAKKPSAPSATDVLHGGGSGSKSAPAASEVLNPTKAPTSNPNRQLASELARAQATLKKVDPKKAAVLDELVRRYGADIPKAEILRAGLKTSGGKPENILGQVKKGGLGALRRVGSVLSRAQQGIYGAISPDEKGESRLESIKEGLSGKQYQTLAGVMDKEAPTEGGLLGLRRAIFKVADFGGTVATDPLTYATFGTTAAAKTGIQSAATTIGREAGEAAGRATATQVAKQGLRSLAPETRAAIEASIRETAGTAASAAKTIQAVEKGASKIRFMGKDLGYHNLPRHSEELLGRAATAERAAAEAARQVPEQAARQAVKDAEKAVEAAKAATKAGPAQQGFGGIGPDVPLADVRHTGAGLADAITAQAAQRGGVVAEDTVKAATERLAGAKEALKAATASGNTARVLESETAFAAANQGKNRLGSLKEVVSPRAALRNPAERAVFSETASKIQGATRRLTSQRAQLLEAAIKPGGQAIGRAAEQDALVAIQAAVDDVARATATSGTTGRALATDVTKAEVAKSLDALAAANPQWKDIIAAVKPLGPAINVERIQSAKTLGDVFEHMVAKPIRSSSEAGLRNALTDRGLDVARRSDVGKTVDEWVATHLDPLDQAANPGIYRKMVSGWRRAAVRTPGFYVTNTAGDYLNVATEVLSHQYGATAAKQSVRDAWKIAGQLGKSDADALAALGPERFALMQKLNANDITGGTIVQDTARGTVEATRRRGSPLRAFDVVARAGQRTSEHARITLALAEVKSGSTWEKAAATVRNTLGDYSDYTKFEQAYIRNHLVPFYKFHRFNTPFQLAKMVTNPKIMAAHQNFQGAFGTDEPSVSALPGRLASISSVALGGGKIFRSNTGIDAAASVVDPLVQTAAGIAGQIPGVNRTPGLASLQAEPGQGAGVRGLSGFMGGPTTAGIVKEIGQWVTSEDFFTGAPISEQQKLRHAYLSMLPDLSRAMRLSSAGQEELPKVILSIMAGISYTDVNDKAQLAEVYRRLDIIRKLMQDAETDGKSASFLQETGVTDRTPTKIPTLTELRDQGVLPTPKK